MERLTEKLADGRNVLKENYAYVTNPKHGSFIEGKAVDKLAEYEQAEEDGLLIRVECRCKDCVHVDYAGCSNTTCYCMKNSCFMQEDDFCKYAEKSKLMNTTEKIGYADNGCLMPAT